MRKKSIWQLRFNIKDITEYLQTKYILPPILPPNECIINVLTLKDISMLGNVHTLNLSNTKVKDVSMLGNVHTLNLSNTLVKDVSMLGNVHTLNLSNTLVKDVSMLGNVHTLNLSNTLVKDVSMLGNVHTLNLSNTLVKDVSMLGNTVNLNIKNTKSEYFKTFPKKNNIEVLTISLLTMEFNGLIYILNILKHLKMIYLSLKFLKFFPYKTNEDFQKLNTIFNNSNSPIKLVIIDI